MQNRKQIARHTTPTPKTTPDVKPKKNNAPQIPEMLVQRAVDAPSTDNLTPDVVQHIQRRYGNRFAAGLVQRARAAQTNATKNYTIGEANDRHEREADNQAASVMQSLGVGGAVQRSSAGGDVMGGTEVSDEVQRDIDRTRGRGQQMDGETRSRMEGAFGSSFAGVNIHTDSKADELSNSLQAKAFTVGSDVYFQRGAYNPGTASGQSLLAHELTHVRQQRGGGIQRMTMIQRALDTIGGTWDTESYEIYEDGGKKGAKIALAFSPNQMVDSKKIGLFQKVKKIVNGRNLDKSKREQGFDAQFGGAKTAYNRTNDEGEGHWDRSLTETNPVYGAPQLGDGQDVSKTPTSQMDMSQEAQDAGTASNYQLGWRYNTWLFGKNKERDAKLYDRPNFDAGEGSEMTFETTAMSIKGGQKGTFYGSVEWGWKIPVGADRPQLIPFSVVSMGTPSANMRELAEIWNENPTFAKDEDWNEIEKDNTQMPTTSYTSKSNNIDLDDLQQVTTAIDTIEDELSNLKGNDKKNAKLELKFLKAKKKNLQDG